MNINLTPKKYDGAVGLDRSPSPGSQARITSLAALLHYKKKTSGTDIKMTPDVKLRFVGFNFGQIQLLRFVVVMVRSNSFGHLESVK